MHITLTGNLGSGKSTICKILENEYGFEIYSTGTIQRKLAAEFGLSVLEMNELMCSDHKYDHLIDDTTTRISKENPDKNIVFDSRLAWNFVEKSFKVFLSVNIDEAARRVYADTSRGAVESYKDEADAKENLKARAANEKARYADLYNVDYFDFDNYNLIIDSSFTNPHMIAEAIVNLAKQGYEEGLTGRKILFSPKRLGVEGAERETRESVSLSELFPAESVTITPAGDDYAVVGDLDVVKKACEDGYPYVCCEM